MNRVTLLIIATVMLTTAPGIAIAAPWTDAQKCSAFKWKAAGMHAQCLLREDARAVKSGKTPDYSACERKLTRKYTNADRKWVCAIEDESANIRDMLLICAEGARTTTASSLGVVEVEPGWKCTGPAPGGCTTICGDGIRAGDEFCDDGNRNSGDGCNADCSSDETCGNGITDLATGEECDGQESCSPDCTFAESCGDLTGRYPAASELQAELLLEDLGNGSLRGRFRGADPLGKYYESVFEMAYTSRTIGSALTAQSCEDIEDGDGRGGFCDTISTDWNPLTLAACTPTTLDTPPGYWTFIREEPEPSASGAFLDAVSY